MRIKLDSIPPVELNLCKSILARRILLDKLMMKYTGEDAIITSGSELKAPHMVGSKHFTGEAIDVRDWKIRTLSNTGKKAFFSGLNEIFRPLKFDIVQHTTHIHIEFDPEIIRDAVTIRMKKRKKGLTLKREMQVVEIPALKFESAFRKVVNKSYDVFKVTANIAGRHYAGVELFKKGKKKSLLDRVREILELILTKLKGG